jgi:hypothetical protein
MPSKKSPRVGFLLEIMWSHQRTIASVRVGVESHQVSAIPDAIETDHLHGNHTQNSLFQSLGKVEYKYQKCRHKSHQRRSALLTARWFFESAPTFANSMKTNQFMNTPSYGNSLFISAKACTYVACTRSWTRTVLACTDDSNNNHLRGTCLV